MEGTEPMPRAVGRARVVVAVVVLLAVGLAALGLARLSGPDDAPRVPPPAMASLAPQARTADDFARAACVRLSLAVQGISADSAAETVRRELAAARALAAEALRRDGTYAELSGGVAALDDAVRRDDAEAAATAVRVARQACPPQPQRR